MFKRAPLILTALFCLYAAAAIWTLHPTEAKLRASAMAAGGSTCTPAAHCTILTITDSCTPACTFNVYRGTAPGAESGTPLNAAPITASPYIDAVTLTGSPQSFYYEIQAVETSGTVTATSGLSTELSDTFPGVPATPSATIANQ